MGLVHFQYPKATDLPLEAKTNEKVSFTVYVVNDDMPSVPGIVPVCDRCKLVIEFYFDKQGTQIWDTVNFFFDACCLYWSGEVTKVVGYFIMPPRDVFVKFKLYQKVDDKWVLREATAMLTVDNPDYPSIWDFWKVKIAGMELWKWTVIWMAFVLGIVIAIEVTA